MSNTLEYIILGYFLFIELYKLNNMKENKFKIGDKVRLINKGYLTSNSIGYEGIITNTCSRGEKSYYKLDNQFWDWSLESDLELVLKENNMDIDKKQTPIKIHSDLVFTYFKAADDIQKIYINNHFQLDGSTTVEAIKGLYDIACEGWKPKIKANHPEVFKEDKVWKRQINQNENKDYCYLNRDKDKGFRVDWGDSRATNLVYTFESEEEAENNALLYRTQMAMRNWAKFHNKIDGFKADWSSHITKYGISIDDQRVSIDQRVSSNIFLFQIAVSSNKRAEEMLKEFMDDIEKLRNLEMI